MKALISPLFRCCVALAVSLFGTQANAQWVKGNGIYGADVRSIITSGNNTFAGTYGGGVFVSKDNGATWADANNGLQLGNSVYVDVLTQSGGYLFAGTWDSGIFRSTDNGSTWASASLGLNSSVVTSFATIDSYLFAGTFNGGVYLSVDSGAVWTAVNNGLTSLYTTCLITNGENLFVGTGDGVFLSTDKGTTWTAVNNGLDTGEIWSLASIGSDVYVSMNNGEIYVTSNNGATWTLTSTLPSSVLVLAANENTLYAGVFNTGVYKSTDGGDSWSLINNKLTTSDVGAIAISGSNLLVGMEGGGIFLSPDDGVSWGPSNSGLADPAVTSIIDNGTYLFAGVQGTGVFRSSDNGVSWSPVNAGLTSLNISSLTASGGYLYAGTGGIPAEFGTGSGMFLSINNGDSWTAVNNGLPTFNPITSILVAGDNLFAGLNGGGVYWSENNGTSWSAANSGLSSGVSSLALIGNNLFAGTYSGGVYVTTDNGVSWSSVNNGLTDMAIYSLAVDSSTLYAGTFDHGLFVSRDSGASWTNIPLPVNEPILSIAVSDDLLGVIIEDGGLYLSANRGKTWCQGLESDFFFDGIGSLHFYKGIVLAGTQSSLYFHNALNQTITFDALQNFTVGDPVFTLTASASSGLPVIYQTTGDDVTVIDNTLGVVRAGRDTLTATQPGDGCNYLPASPVSRIFCVNPAKPDVSLSTGSSGAPVLTSSASSGNQWFLNGVTIPGATNQLLTPTIPGDYAVQVTVDNCQSAVGEFPAYYTEDAPLPQVASLFPNPASDHITVTGVQGMTSDYSVVNCLGNQVSVELVQQNDKLEGRINDLPGGIYLLKINTDTSSHVFKFVKY